METMETVITRIEEYVVLLNPAMEDEELLDFATRETVDRALSYMNRSQLIEKWEEDNNNPPPIPRSLERVLAGVVIGVFKNIGSRNMGARGVTKVKDGIQEVTYTENARNYLVSSTDNDIFGGAVELMATSRLGNVR